MIEHAEAGHRSIGFAARCGQTYGSSRGGSTDHAHTTKARRARDRACESGMEKGKASQLSHRWGRHLHWKPAVAGVGAIAASTALVGLVPSVAQAQATSRCVPNVGNSGLSAAVVAQAHQTIANKMINAQGCDIGIYVGAGVDHVTINSVTVFNANFQGIFAERTSYILVENSTIKNNGFHTTAADADPLPGSGVRSHVGQSFAISLFGVSYSTVKGNTVFNNGRGGIGLMDNGSNDPGTINQDRSALPVSSSHDQIVDNTTYANYNGCGIVAATQNFNGSLSDLLISGNTIAGTGFASNNGFASKNDPDIGGIVVAADLPGSSVSDVTVSDNVVTGSFEGGVIVNAEAPNSFTEDVHVTGNTVIGNNWGHLEAPNTAGILVFANPEASGIPNMIDPANIDTVISNNIVADQFYGIWSLGGSAPIVFGNDIQVTDGGTPIAVG